MADYQVVDRAQLDADMTDVADHIRAKAEISTPLEWPEGYKTAVDAISTGVELPELTNPGDGSKLLAGYQLIGGDGAVVDGNIPTVDAATPGLTIQANGDVVAYVDQAAGYTPGGYKTYKQSQDVIPAQTITPGTEDQEIPAYRYLTGKQTIKGDPNLIPENLPEDVSLFGVQGTRQLSRQEPPSKDVDFYDYDGARLYSYTLAEVQAMTELPPLPSREGLICQEWNWTLDEVKSLTRPADIGATYITDDGSTRLKVNIPKGRNTPLIGLRLNGTATIDWGDGSEPDVITGTSLSTQVWAGPHEYVPGRYTISIHVVGSFTTTGNYDQSNSRAALFRGSKDDLRLNNAYMAMIEEINFGANITELRNYTAPYAARCRAVSIPNGIQLLGAEFLHNARSMSCLVVPRSCREFRSDALLELIGCKVLCLPCSGFTLGTNALGQMSSLRRVRLPDSLASVGNNILDGARSLLYVEIPDAATSIGNYSFRNQWGVTSFRIPSNVVSIGNYAFANCYGVKYYDFSEHTQVPTLGGSTVFQNIAADCEIRVPAALYDEWVAATNWSVVSANIVGV